MYPFTLKKKMANGEVTELPVEMKDVPERIFDTLTRKVSSGVSGQEYYVVRVQVHGIVRFAAWWFVLWSIVGLVVVLAKAF